jgi:hypothetical protein
VNPDKMVHADEIDWGTEPERAEELPDGYLLALNSNDLLNYTIGLRADFQSVRVLLSEALRRIVQVTAQLRSARRRISELEAQLKARL